MAGAITETIDVNAGPAVAGLREFTDALEQAAAKYADLEAKMSKGLGGGASAAGADKMAAAMDKAAASIGSAVDKINASLEKVGASADSAASGLERLDEAAATAEASLSDAAVGADEAAAASDRLAASADAAGAALDRQALSGKRAGESAATASESGASGFLKFAKVVTIGAGVAAAYGIDKAMKLNAEVTRLYTAAGLSGVKPADVTAATLRIGTQTGFSGQAIAEAMYHPVSAGLNFKTAQGLTQQSANLANIHGANLEDTTYAMSSVMKGYNLGAGQVNKTAAELNSIVGKGDMRFQDFNESVKNWVPTAASMGISMQSMGAGLDYLTDRGNSAEVASTRLTMGLSMATSGSKAANEYMKDLGLTTGSLDLKNKSLQKTMEAGGLTTNKFAADLKKPDGLYTALNDMKTAFDKAGLSSSQADTVMAKIFGGGRSDKAIVALMQNLDGVKQKYQQIGQGVSEYGGDVAKEQQTAAQKWANFKAGMGNLATGFGGTLLPYFTSLAGQADKFLTFLQGSKGATNALVGGAGALAAIFAGNKLVSGVGSAVKTGETALRGVGKISEVLHIPGLSGLSNIGKSAGLDTAGVALKGAAADLSAAAEKLGGSGLGGTAGKVEGAAGAGEGAVAGTAGETVGLSAGMLAAPLLGAGAGLALGLYLNQYKKYDGPQVAGQLGPHAPAAGIGSQAWKQYDQVSSAPAKVAAPDLGALAQAKAKAAQAAAGIHAAVESPLSKPVKAAAPDLAAYAQAKAKAAQDGAAIDAGLASGINANSGQAVAAAQNVASQVEAAMKAALKVSSPSKVTQAIGTSAAQGLVVGLEGGTAAVNAAATALGKNVAKAADITTINKTVDKLISYNPQDTALTKLLKADNTKLVTLANRRAQLEAEITDSQQIAQQAISNASIMNAGSYTSASANGPVSSYATIQGMQSMAADQKAFAQQVGQLQKMGLNATSLNQIVQSGASAGLPVAQGLTSGGKGAIQQINQLEQQIHASAVKLGDEGAGPMYQAGAQAAQGVAQGVKSQIGAADSAMTQLIKSMIAAAKAALNSHSPSLVFRDIGMTIPQGAAQGVDAGTGLATAAVGRMGSQMAGAFHPGYGGGGHGGGGSGSGGGATNVTVHMTVQGSVMSEHDLTTTVQNGLLKLGNRNWQTGAVLPGRRN